MKRKNKKAQVKIQEMAFVLLAVVFLVALLFLFFARFQYSQLQESVTQVREARTITMLSVVASLPELRCSSSFSSASEIACIDKDKVDVFNKGGNIRKKYTKIWQAAQISKITIDEIYPEGQSYLIYTQEPGESTETYATYIPLCEETTGNLKCVVAKIRITTNMP